MTMAGRREGGEAIGDRRQATDCDQRLWVPDNPDGSGWADVDWVSAVRGVAITIGMENRVMRR
jgi:hypothetical protein